MASSNPLILVDGSSYLYRAFFASQQADLRTSTGLPSGAVRVMANMMRSLRKQYPDCHVAVVFDAKARPSVTTSIPNTRQHAPACRTICAARSPLSTR
jgi:DNA polymerase-1